MSENSSPVRKGGVLEAKPVLKIAAPLVVLAMLLGVPTIASAGGGSSHSAKVNDEQATSTSQNDVAQSTGDVTERSISLPNGGVRVYDTVLGKQLAENGQSPTVLAASQQDTVGGCQVYYPEGTKIALATAARDSDCWDSSMLTKKSPTVSGRNMKFLGWSVNDPNDEQLRKIKADFTYDNQGTAPLAPNQTITMPAHATTVYATWRDLGQKKMTVCLTNGQSSQFAGPTVVENDDGSWPTASGWEIGKSPIPGYVVDKVNSSGSCNYQVAPASYTVRYDANGGQGNMADQSFTFNVAQNLRENTFTRSGYTWTGWKADDGKAYFDQQSVKNLTTQNGGVVTMHAQWEPKSSGIRYHGNGSTGGNTPNQTGQVDQTLNISQNGFTRTGYTFTGWKDQPTGGTTYNVGQGVKLDEDGLDLYAQWNANPATLNYEGNHSGVTGSTASQTGVTDQTVQTRQNGFKLSGYTFTGWNTQPDGQGTPYQEGADYRLPAGTSTLYAQWKANSTQITYHPNNPDGTTVSGHTDPTPGTTGEQVPVSENGYDVPGYTFTGWTDKPNGGNHYQPGDKVEMPADGKDMYANWTADPAQIDYVANNGEVSGTTPSTKGKTGEQVQFANESYTYDHKSWVFKGWNTSPNGQGTSYQPGQSFKLPAGTTTVYAQWDHAETALHYDANGGTGIMTDDTGKVGDNVTVKKNGFVRVGYTFTGWNTSKDGTGQTIKEGSQVQLPAGGMTVYAQWKELLTTLPSTGSTTLDNIIHLGVWGGMLGLIAAAATMIMWMIRRKTTAATVGRHAGHVGPRHK